ncbi:sensor histidine kinase [Microtetraspora glauca]|uniref:histidine kinase n=1 Tax=Microtetraspora glauca TaxID=1996 RepID=A0ABV3GDC7_MICGL
MRDGIPRMAGPVSTEQQSGGGAEGTPEAAGARSGTWADRLAPRNWRVPSRLTALIVAPTLVAVALAGARVVDSVGSLNGYQRTSSAAEYSVRLRDLAQQLAMERDLAARGGGAKRVFNVDGTTKLTLTDQRVAVDGLARKVAADLAKIDDSYGVRAVQQAEQAGNRLSGLENVREKGTEEDYTGIIAGLLRLHDELGQSSDDALVVADMRALSALAYAKEEASQQRQMLTRELMEANQRFTGYELRDFIASQSRQQGYIDRFYAETGSGDAAFLAGLLSDKDVVDAELTKSWAITLAIQNSSLSRYQARDRTLVRWFQHSTKTIGQLAVAEKRLSGAVIDRAKDLQSAEQRNALIAAGLILALLLLVLATTVLIARSMVRPLRRLRAEALEVAGMRLPEVVRRMRESDDPENVPEVRPIDLGTNDEIGEVAQAFDEVHAQAVRLAAEESRLRSNVNAMFVNLSWRTQTLVERQISLIDGLERGEQDGARLSDLFKLDHLATRMRRNSENLLVLAGHEPARKRSKPALLVDVVRAALSEVEDYERVTVRVHRTASVAGYAANDSVHLVAELVENAIAYSSDRTKVVVSSDRIEGGAVLLSVSDSGIGMSQEELAEANRRLAEPPMVDVSVSRRMGLFVVGRLALRHGIRVQLRRGDAGGLIAMVLFPAELVSGTDRPVAGQAPGTTTGQVPGNGPAPAGSGFGQGQGNGFGQVAGNGVGRAQIAAAPGPATGPVARTAGAHAAGTGASGSGAPGREPSATSAPSGAGTTRGNGLPTRTPAASGFSASGGAAQLPTGGFSAFGDSGRQDNGSTGNTGGFSAFGDADRQSTGQFPAFRDGDRRSTGEFPAFRDTDRQSTGQFPAFRDGDRRSTGQFPAFRDADRQGPSGPVAYPAPTGDSGGSAGLPNRAGTADRTAPADGSGRDSRQAPPASYASTMDAPSALPRFTEHSGAFPVEGAPPVPSHIADDAHLERGDEFLPIFASVESAWFRRPATPAAGAVPGAAPAGAVPGTPGSATGSATGHGNGSAQGRTVSPGGGATAVPATSGGPGGDPSRGGWASRADSGFEAAAAASAPSLGGVTSAGLPKRTPRANLVPGSVGAAPGTPAPPRPAVSPDLVRSRLSSYQQGVRRGRADVSGAEAEKPGNEEESS